MSIASAILAEFPIVIEQIAFMFFVLVSSPFAWTMKRQTASLASFQIGNGQRDGDGIPGRMLKREKRIIFQKPPVASNNNGIYVRYRVKQEGADVRRIGRDRVQALRTFYMTNLNTARVPL